MFTSFHDKHSYLIGNVTFLLHFWCSSVVVLLRFSQSLGHLVVKLCNCRPQCGLGFNPLHLMEKYYKTLYSSDYF